MEDNKTALYKAFGFDNARDVDTFYTKSKRSYENKIAYEKRKAATAATAAAAAAATAAAAAAVAAEAAVAAVAAEAAAAAVAAEAATAAVAAGATLPISSDALAVIELQTSKRGLEDRGQLQYSY